MAPRSPVRSSNVWTASHVSIETVPYDGGTTKLNRDVNKAARRRWSWRVWQHKHYQVDELELERVKSGRPVLFLWPWRRFPSHPSGFFSSEETKEGWRGLPGRWRWTSGAAGQTAVSTLTFWCSRDTNKERQQLNMEVKMARPVVRDVDHYFHSLFSLLPSCLTGFFNCFYSKAALWQQQLLGCILITAINTNLWLDFKSLCSNKT